MQLLEKMYSISLCKVLCARSLPSAKAWGRSWLLYRSKKYRIQTLSPKTGILFVLLQGLRYLQFRLRKIEPNTNSQQLPMRFLSFFFVPTCLQHIPLEWLIGLRLFLPFLRQMLPVLSIHRNVLYCTRRCMAAFPDSLGTIRKAKQEQRGHSYRVFPRLRFFYLPIRFSLPV